MVAPVAVAAAPAVGAGAAAAGGAAVGGVSAVLGGLFSKKAADSAGQAGQQAANTISKALEATLAKYQEYFDKVITSLQEGEAEASDEIMAGLGMSIEERTKFFDIAKENLDWVVDFGKAQKGDFEGSIKSSDDALKQSQQFYDHYKELVFNPDAIYDTEVYNSIKNRAVQEWGNFYSGKGLLSGNAQEGMVDRMSELAYGFLGGERNAALAGMNAGQSQSSAYLNQAKTSLDAVGLGANAASQVSNLAFQTGGGNANDIMSAHSSLAAITQAFNPANAYAAAGDFNANAIASAGNATANAQLAAGLGKGSIYGDIGNGLIQTGVSGITQGFLGNRGGSVVQDAEVQRGSSYGDYGPAGSAGSGWYNTYNPFEKKEK